MGEHDLSFRIKVPKCTVHGASSTEMQQFSGMPAIPQGPCVCSTFQSSSRVVCTADPLTRKTSGPGHSGGAQADSPEVRLSALSMKCPCTKKGPMRLGALTTGAADGSGFLAIGPGALRA